MQTSTKRFPLALFTLFIGNLAQATPLEKLHFNERWLTHAGTITNTVFSTDHQKLETVTCDGTLHSAYTKPGELHEYENAYFMMKTFSHCSTQKFSEPDYFDLIRLRYVPETIWASIDVNLTEVAASAHGEYDDNWLAKDHYTTHDSEVIYENRLADGTRMGLYTLKIDPQQKMNFTYKEYDADQSVIRIVNGIFSTENTPDPIDEE